MTRHAQQKASSMLFYSLAQQSVAIDPVLYRVIINADGSAP